MPKLSLTLSKINKIVPPKSGRVDYFDTELKGFLLRVSADYVDKAGEKQKGSRVFYVQVDVLDLITRKYVTRKAKVGAYGEFTPDEARKKARTLLQQLRAGQPVVPVNVPTLEQMLKTHLADKKFKPRTEQSYLSEIPAKFGSWLGLPLTEISKIPPDVIIDTFKQIEKVNGKMAAKNTFGKLQAILNYAKIKYPAVMPVNPCAVIGAAGLWPETRSRDDCLKGNDFKVFNDAINSFNAITRDCYLFCLYQGLRNRESAGLRWEYVDLEQATLMLPDTKSNQPLVVPLSRQSLDILKRRNGENPEGNPFVFPSVNANHASKTGHVALKADLLQFKTGLKLTVQGLRRSFITTGERLKLRRQDIDKLTNHADGSVTGKHYDCTDVEDLGAPLQAIANEIERLMVHGAGGRVVQLARATSS